MNRYFYFTQHQAASALISPNAFCRNHMVPFPPLCYDQQSEGLPNILIFLLLPGRKWSFGCHSVIKLQQMTVAQQIPSHLSPCSFSYVIPQLPLEGLSTLGNTDIPNPPGCVPESPAPGHPALAGALKWMISKDLSQPKKFCYSVI